MEASAIPVLKNKKLVIIGPAHPLRGGLATFNERLAREFMHEGFDVSIFSFSLQYPSFLFPGTTQYSSEPAPAGIHIETCINSINPVNWVKVGRKLSRLKPDIIVVRYWLPFMGPCLGTILRKVKKNKHSKIICIADNIQPHEKRPGDKAFTRYFIKPVNAFITMSDKVMKDLRKLSASKPAKRAEHPLYDNFGSIISKEEARKHLGIDPDEKIILFFGFIRHYKGLDILLDSMSLLKDERVKLLIAGEFYEDPKIYLQKIEQLGIKDKLIMKTDFIPDSEVKYYLCAADAVVQPYRNATQSGVTPLAYHFEKPMIVTNVGGLPDLVPHGTVGIVAEANARSIADAIKEFYGMGSAHFMSGLKEEKKKYSWNKLTASIIELAANQ